MNEIKKCSKCNTENPQAANFCRKCRYEFPEATKGGLSLKPEIKFLRIKEPQYVVGSTVHIEWDADNFTQIKLAGEDVTFYKDVELLVEKVVELYLVVANDYDQVQQSLRVVPTPMPNIRRFTASYYNVMDGKKAKLSWSVDGAIRVLLRYGTEVVDVSLLSELVLFPDSDTTYTLVAFSVDDKITVEKSVSVKVHHEVVIKEFSSDMSQIFEMQPVKLQWIVDNAEKIMLYPNDINVTSQTSIQVYPNRTMIYRLVASNVLSIHEQLITVGVKALPRFNVKVSDSLSRLQISNCEIDFAPLSDSIKETNIDRWLLTPSKQPITKKIWEHGIFKKLRTILSKRINEYGGAKQIYNE